MAPWHQQPEALAILRGIASAPVKCVRHERGYYNTRDEWLCYDDADWRYQRLNTICNDYLNPLLADAQACRDGRTLAAGVLDSVDKVIDAASTKPAIFNLNDADDRTEYHRLRGLIFANRPASIAA